MSTSSNSDINFYVVMIIPITVSIISLLGTLYIFYRTYIRWRYENYKNIPLSSRFPFYISITDFLNSSATLINLSYSFSNGPKLAKGESITLPSPICEIFGLINVSFVLLNILLVGSISVVTWLRVVREYYIKLGKCDYRIWLPIVFISLLIPLCSVHDFGAQIYWCGAKSTNRLTVISAFVLSLITVTLTTIIFCYVQVIRTINCIRDDDDDDDDDDDSSITISHTYWVQRTNNIKKKTIKKVLKYILVFIIQYIPIVALNICRFLKIQHIALLALSPSAISIGGIGNLIQFICNEGFVFSPSHLTLSSSNGNNSDQKEQQSNNTTNTNVTDVANNEQIA